MAEGAPDATDATDSAAADVLMPTAEGPPLSIRKALKDQHVFVTGATGFVVPKIIN
jgi:hypothetical protein